MFAIALLHAAVVPSADKLALLIENRRPDGDAAFCESGTRFFDGHGKHRSIVRPKAHGVSLLQAKRVP